jgi:caffeoyl-CoA O-methyltransferase
VSTRNVTIIGELHEYVIAHGSVPDAVARDLIAETRAAVPDVAEMQIAPDQAGLLTLLTRLVGARTAVEVGTFTGFSALAIARGLADGGRLICFDISAEYTDIARRYWARAGLADRIELRLGPAAERVKELPAEPVVDFAFIDADKQAYPVYWAELVPRMRSGGLIAVDNVLRGGRVLAPQSADDLAIVRFNEAVLADERVDAVMVGVADGLTLARKR